MIGNIILLVIWTIFSIYYNNKLTQKIKEDSDTSVKLKMKKMLIIILLCFLILGWVIVAIVIFMGPCSECNDNGSIRCDKCEYGHITTCYHCIDGYQKCNTCEGTGTFYQKCINCKGKGIIINPFTWEEFDCKYCGNGTMTYCLDCGGDGKTIKTCSFCHGTYYEKCSNCNKGYLPCPKCSKK